MAGSSETLLLKATLEPENGYQGTCFMSGKRQETICINPGQRSSAVHDGQITTVEITAVGIWNMFDDGRTTAITNNGISGPRESPVFHWCQSQLQNQVLSPGVCVCSYIFMYNKLILIYDSAIRFKMAAGIRFEF
jgi:hypothetical protein